jgi:4-amino-4-deoxy-L-arabinose transferase-like glycosyltransferase
LLVAPATLASPSLAVTRLWLALLSSVLMYVGFRPWLRLTRPWSVPLAALLFSGLWQTIFYGAQAMPNLFVACFAVPAVALTVLYVREPERWSRLLWLGLCIAAIALIRPSDGLYTAAPIAVVALLTRAAPWRSRLLAAGVAVAGFVAGTVEWVVEAYVRFGGPVHRYHEAIAEQGGSGLQFSLAAHARALAGPILCRAGCDPHPSTWVMVWWFVLPVLVAAGLLLARRGDRLPLVAATVTGLVMAAEYIFGIAYAAPRFLLPTYALLFLAVAVAIVELVERAPAPPLRAAIAGGFAVLVLVQVLSQVYVLRRDVLPPNNRGLSVWAAQAWAIRHQVIGSGDCVLAGPASAPVAYVAECKGISQTSMRTETFPPSTMRVFMSRNRIKIADTWLSSWTEHRIRLPKHKGGTWIYLPPGEQPRGTLRSG